MSQPAVNDCVSNAALEPSDLTPSNTQEVRSMYENCADRYNTMMDDEIKLPVYNEILTRLSQRIANVKGAVLDTSCGSGHMLFMFNEKFNKEKHSLIGMDLSPRMVAITKRKLRSIKDVDVQVRVGCMLRDIGGVDDGSCSAVISFFALQHIHLQDAAICFREWHRVLAPGGYVVVGCWEGKGAIDYGDSADIVSLRYTVEEISTLAEQSGFVISKCASEPVEDFPMHAIYLEAAK